MYQSLDDGLTWTLFPSTTFGAVAQGGNLPHVAVTDLDLSLGNIDTNTGMPNLAGPYDPNSPTATPDPDVLLATTYGRGSFAINLAPLVFPSTVQVNSGTRDRARRHSDGDHHHAHVQRPQLDHGFGNATRITIKDVSDPTPPNGGSSAASIPARRPRPTSRPTGPTPSATSRSRPTTQDGPEPRVRHQRLKKIQIYATDDAGAVGNMVTLTFTLNAAGFPPLPPTSPPTLVTLALRPSEAVVVSRL